MLHRRLMAAIALAAALHAPPAGAQSFDLDKYPNLEGQWRPIGDPGRFDPSKPPGPGQEAPLTTAYQKIYEANLADQAAGGRGADRSFICLSPGMPRVANGYGQMEFVLTPETTHVLVEHIHDNRRIFTDGRAWPDYIEPSYVGYSIGHWVDSQGNGPYDTLAVETRGFKGPRFFDDTGIPLDSDNETVVQERIYLDKADRDVLHNAITVNDHALTRPWTVIKSYRRDADPHPSWREVNCEETNNHVEIGHEIYSLSQDGLLMPGQKGQTAPDLRYFKKSGK